MWEVVIVGVMYCHTEGERRPGEEGGRGREGRKEGGREGGRRKEGGRERLKQG